MKKSANRYSACDCELCTIKSKCDPINTDRSKIDQSHRIYQFIHCPQCVRELTEVLRQDRSVSMSPSDLQEIEVGFTDVGIQLWCKRHNHNIVHFDFGGVHHRAFKKATISES